MEYYTIEKYEYQYKDFIGMSIKKIVDNLNELGKQGWELTNIVMNDAIGIPKYILKRKLVSKS